MGKLYKFLKYFFITFWAVFVVAPFLWALTTSFKDFNSVNGGATYIPWVDFEPKLEGWRVLIKSPANGGVDIKIFLPGLLRRSQQPKRVLLVEIKALPTIIKT